MKELEIKKIFEKTEFEDQYAHLVGIETGGFGVICKLKGQVKVCFSHAFGQALSTYFRCAQEVIGGPGFAFYN